MPSYRELYEPLARQAAETHNIDVAVFFALINKESTWNPSAEHGFGPDRSVGLGQVTPYWHPDCTNLFDPEHNLFCAAKILKANLDSFGGSYEWALTAYHNGSNRARSFGNAIPESEMALYVRPILNDAARIRLEFKPTEIATVVSTATPINPNPFPSPTPTPPTLVDVAFLVLPLVWATVSQ